MQHRGHCAWKKKTSECLIPTDRTLAQPDDSDPADVTRERFDDCRRRRQRRSHQRRRNEQKFSRPTSLPSSSGAGQAIAHDDVEMVRQFVLRAAAVRRGGRRWRDSGPRVPRDGHACRRGHAIRRHVVRGAQSARRGERCHSFVPRTSYDKPRTSRRSDVTRSRGTFSWLARRWPAERRSWPTSSSSPEHLSPTWTHVARVRPQTRRPTTKSASASKTSRFARPTAVRSFSRPTADGHGDNQDWSG